MNIVEKLQKILKIEKQKKIEIGVQEIEKAYQNTETRDEAIREATKRATQQINSNPELALKVLKLMEESEEIPKQVLIETIKNIPNTAQIQNPGQTVVKAVENSELLNSGDIKEIIKESDISIPTAQKVADQIPNDVLREKEKERLEKIEKERKKQARKEEEQRISQELKDMYINCKGIRDTDILNKIKEFRRENRTQKVKEMITRVLARKVAIEFKQVGNTRLYEISKIITPEEMLESGFQNLVEEEYEEIKDIDAYKGIDGKKHEYKKDILMQGILGEIAKNVVRTYNEVGIIDIPQSEAMKNLTQEEEEEFIKQIQIYGGEIEDIDKIKNQIRGIVDYQLKDLVKMMEKVPKDKIGDYVRKFKQQIAKGNCKDIQLSSQLEENVEGLKEKLSEISEQDALEIIEEAKNSAKEKIGENEITNKRKEKNQQTRKNGTTQADDDEYTH